MRRRVAWVFSEPLPQKQSRKQKASAASPSGGEVSELQETELQAKVDRRGRPRKYDLTNRPAGYKYIPKSLRAEWDEMRKAQVCVLVLTELLAHCSITFPLLPTSCHIFGIDRCSLFLYLMVNRGYRLETTANPSTRVRNGGNTSLGFGFTVLRCDTNTTGYVKKRDREQPKSGPGQAQQAGEDLQKMPQEPNAASPPATAKSVPLGTFSIHSIAE